MVGRDGADPLIVVGRVGAPHGVRGWVRIDSAARPPEAILDFAEWWLGLPGSERCYTLCGGAVKGGRIVAALDGVADRAAAGLLRHARISVVRSALPVLATGEWYWADLIGLEVATREGVVLGRVDHLLETGANDVLVVIGERERLIPWIADEVIEEVDPLRGHIVVRWDPDF